MNVTIRPAKPVDASPIARIAALADLATIEADAPRLRTILRERLTFVATAHGEVIGFIDGFFTPDLAGARRFELDLLAVAPAVQGSGFGGSLVAASLAAAVAAGAQSGRALVRCDNAPMQQLCRRHGFSCSPERFELRVSEPQDRLPGACHHDARLLVVETLSYAGIWIERDLSQAAIDAAHRLASQSQLSLIGAVIPVTAPEKARLLKANSFRLVGQYHWWAVNLRNG